MIDISKFIQIPVTVCIRSGNSSTFGTGYSYFDILPGRTKVRRYRADDREYDHHQEYDRRAAARASPSETASRKYGTAPSSAGAAPSWAPSSGTAESRPSKSRSSGPSSASTDAAETAA